MHLRPRITLPLAPFLACLLLGCGGGKGVPLALGRGGAAMQAQGRGFGGGNRVITAMGTGASAITALAVQPDGRLLAAGTAESQPNLLVVARYTPSGLPDGTFGGSGLAQAGLDGTPAASATAVAVQRDGKILVAGSFNSGLRPEWGVARFNVNGSLDSGFGPGHGVVTLPMGAGGGHPYSVAVQPDGKILLGGYCIEDSRTCFALVRLGASGELDGGFGRGGRAVTPVGNQDASAYAMALQPDGRILLGGCVQVPAGEQDAVLVRYTPNGALDAGFGASGIAVARFAGGNACIRSLALQPDGHVLAAGEAASPANASDPGVLNVALARFTSNGSLDLAWNASGRLVRSVGSGGSSARGLVLQADGKAVVAASVLDRKGVPQMALLRFNSSGGLDGGFGKAGVLLAAWAQGGAPNALVRLADGRLVAGGAAYRDDGGSDFGMLRVGM